jgi:hypothetical protein
MIKLELIRNQTVFHSWDFETEADFIDFTIEAIKLDTLGGDEYEEFTSYGFNEIIDSQTLDEDGEVIEEQSHWTGNLQSCLDYWKHASTIYAGEKYSYWKVSK